MPKEIAARRAQRRWLTPIATAVTLAIAAGCAMLPADSDLPSDAGTTPTIGTATGRGTPIITEGRPAFGLGRTTGVGRATGTLVNAERDRRLRDSRLQQHERMIEGRIETIERQRDIIDMRRRSRRELEPLKRNRPGPREVLLEQEQRGLQFERRSVQGEQDRLEFERRVDRSPQNPFTDSRRFPSRGIN